MNSVRQPSERDSSAIRNYPRLLHQYARLLDLTSSLASTLDLESLLRSIVEAAKELTESEGASLLLYDKGTNHLYFEAATGPFTEELGRIAVPVENSIAGWVFTHGEPLLVGNTVSDPRFFREIDLVTRFATRSVVGVPLRTKDKTLGVIEAVNKNEGTFSEEDLQLLQSLAAQAAISIENSRLFQQSDLIAEMVHELRTPLTSLTAAAHILQRTDLPEEQSSRLAETIYREVRRLNEMSSDFLDWARLESGRARFIREPVHVGGLVLECLEIIRPQSDAAQVCLDHVIDADLSYIVGDRNRLKQAILNLLTNAIKYNQPEGKVSVEVRQGERNVIISVHDTGKGIPLESLDHIFERFYRVPAQERTITGTGLGLAITKRIVNAHDGTIDVFSEIGKGSTFTVTLPAGAPSSGEARLPEWLAPSSELPFERRDG